MLIEFVSNYGYNMAMDQIQTWKTKYLWVLAFVFNIISFFFLIFKIRPSGKTMALKYNILIGVEWFGKGYNLYYIPAIGLALLGINIYLFKKLEINNQALAWLTALFSVWIQALLLLAIIFLKTVN